MPYTKTVWQDEILDGAERFEVLNNSGVAVSQLTELAQCMIQLKTAIFTQGTPIDAANLNKIEQAIYDLFVAVESPTTNDTGYTLKVLTDTEAWSVGDGKSFFHIPTELAGAVLVSAQIFCTTPSTHLTEKPTVQIARGRRATPTSTPTWVDMLSTALTIDKDEYSSNDASTPRVINTANDDVTTDDLIRIDIDAVGTGTKGLDVVLVFRQ